MTKEKRVTNKATTVEPPHRPSKARIVSMLRSHTLSRGEYSWSRNGDGNEQLDRLEREYAELENKLLSDKRLVAISKRLETLRAKRRQEYASLNHQRIVLIRQLELRGPTPKLIDEIASFLGLPPE